MFLDYKQYLVSGTIATFESEANKWTMQRGILRSANGLTELAGVHAHGQGRV